MPWPDAIGTRPLETGEAYQALEAFAHDHGRAPLLLLMHAAVPEVLRADLLHLIRVNFMPGAADLAAEADVLLSPLTTALGGGYYRIDAQVRWHALALLRSLTRDEPRSRQRRVAELLWRYLDGLARDAATGSDPALAQYIEVQRWVALAYLDPDGAAHAFAEALRGVAESPAAARARLGGLAAALELPLAGEQELLAYAKGLDALVAGDDEQARQWLGALGGEALQVGDVSLRPASEWLEGLASEVPGADTRPVCLLIHGHEFEGGSPDALAALRVIVEPALRALDGWRSRVYPVGSARWIGLLLDLLRADRVVVDLSDGSPTAHLLLGVAWALRAGGVVALAGREQDLGVAGSAGGVRYDRAAIGGGSDAPQAEVTQLTGLLDAALAAAAPSPLARIWPDWQPPAWRPDPRPPAWPAPPRGGQAMVLGAADRPPLGYADVVAVLHGARLTAVRHDPVGARALTRAAVEPVLRADLLVADFDGLAADDFVELGLRLGTRPDGTLVLRSRDATASKQVLAALLGAKEYARRDPGLIAELERTLHAALRTGAAPNAVWAELPNLHPSPLPAAAPRPPEPPPIRVFVSYSRSAYGDIVRALARLLHADPALPRIELRYDAHLQAGADWADELARMLAESDAVVAVVGPPTLKSRYAGAEIERALSLGKRVVPVVVEWFEMPPALASRQAANVDADGRLLPLGTLRGKRLNDALARTAQRIRGALAAPAEPRAEGSVRRRWEVTVERPEPGRLHYRWQLGGRVDTHVVEMQPELLEKLAARVQMPGRIDGGVAASLAELVVPPALRPQGGDWLQLQLELNTATLPWELLFTPPRAGADSLVSVLRIPPGTMTTSHGPARALVIADPKAGGSAPPLPGARAAAATAAESLRAAGFEVVASDREDAEAVVSKLFSGDWQLVLVSGHTTSPPLPRGFALGGDTVLGATELRRLRKLPLLILDGDSIGRVGAPGSAEVDRDAPLAQLLGHGPACVVAPAWDVDDESGRAFVATLVGALCDGATLETAAARARRAAFEARPDGSGWAAYQVWGPPGFRLAAPGQAAT